MHKFIVKLHGRPEVEIDAATLTERHKVGDEGQHILMDCQTLTDRNDPTPGKHLVDFLFRIQNTGGSGIHKQPAEHGCAIERLAVRIDPALDADLWESDASIGWRSGRTVIAVRDAKFMGARRDRNNPTTEIEIIHADTPKEVWQDNPWGGNKGERPESHTALQLPGGRMLAYRLIETDNPLLVELDDWSLIGDLNIVRQHFGPWAHLHEMPQRMVEWIRKFSGVGTRQEVGDEDGDGIVGEMIYSDLSNGATFVSNYVQGPARWATWNVDAELDIKDMPDSYHKHPAVWPDHTWHDGHDNLHYELALVAFREFLRWDAIGDYWRAAWSWWMFSRFAQWAATSGLCWSAPQRGGNDRRGWQWGEKSSRGSTRTFVGGLPGSFSLTTQKLYTRNVIAAAALPYPAYRDALTMHRDAVLNTMGEGDELYGSRDMWFVAHAKIHLDKIGDAVGQPNFFPDDEIGQSVDKILSSRDPGTGLWPNMQQNPKGLTNVFEQCQVYLALVEAHVNGYRDLTLELDEIGQLMRSRFVREFGRWVVNLYQWTPKGVPGFVSNGTAIANGLDLTEFTRPYMAVVLGSHAYITGDQESRRLFLKMLDTLGELADWNPPLTLVTSSELHPLGRTERDVKITHQAIPQAIRHPGTPAHFHLGMHFSAWWKVLSSTFAHADAIGVLYRELK